MAKPTEAPEILEEFQGQSRLEMALEIKWLRWALSQVGWFPRDGKEFPGRGQREND